MIARLGPERVESLRESLERMNKVPGIADPDNAILPFGAYERLHFARLALLDDPTTADIEIYGVVPPPLPIYLAFMGDCDGSAHELLAEMVDRAAAGLRQIFGHCADFDPTADLLGWMLAHDRPMAACYVNWVGRTVQQIKEESVLHRILRSRLSHELRVPNIDARALRHKLVDYTKDEIRAGRLRLTPPVSTPLGWLIASTAHLIALPLVAIVLLPLIIVVSPFIVWRLRRLEASDAEICPRPDLDSLQALQRLEDVDVSNQYTAIGSLKPGRFRGGLVQVLLVLIDYFARHVFTRGYLARVRTIHFARWVFLDGKARMLFASSYDGVHEAYMDDFINKVAWGLNLVFSNGVGWPRTDWLIARGARREHLFKYFQRRHQLPTQVWYKAYPGLTLIDLERNHRIRQGLQRADPSAGEALTWLNLL